MNIEETINNIVDRILNEELSKKMEEAVDAVSEDMGKMPEERDEFDGRDSEVVGVDSDIEKQRMEEEMGEEEVDEGNAFSGARDEAIKNGEKNSLLMVRHIQLKVRKTRLKNLQRTLLLYLNQK